MIVKTLNEELKAELAAKDKQIAELEAERTEFGERTRNAEHRLNDAIDKQQALQACIDAAVEDLKYASNSTDCKRILKILTSDEPQVKEGG